jgi:hypothetical protein
MGAWKDMLIDADNAMAERQVAEDWYRYEMERDDQIARRRELITQARRLQNTGLKLRRFFPDLGEFNLALAAEFRAEALQIKRDWR